MPKASRRGRVVTYFEELPFIKSYDPSITWCGEISRHIKSVISPLVEDLQSGREYLRQPLVFMWTSALREISNFFSEVFC